MRRKEKNRERKIEKEKNDAEAHNMCGPGKPKRTEKAGENREKNRAKNTNRAPLTRDSA
jgi:hypothetical protein